MGVGQVAQSQSREPVVEAVQNRLCVVDQELRGPGRQDLTADGGAGRLGCPHGERAPGGVLRGTGVAQLQRELVVLLRDPEIAQYRVCHVSDVPH